MGSHALQWTYNYETLAKLSGWPYNRLAQDSSRENANFERLDETCIWLAENGRPELRAEMAKRLLPTILGLPSRGQAAAAQLTNIISTIDLLYQIFRRDDQLRKARAKKIVKSKAKKLKEKPQ